MAIIETYNRALFLMINGTPSAPAWLVGTALACANDLIYGIPVILVMMWLSGNQRQRELAIRACAVTILALGANQAIGLAWPHPRPFMIGLGHTFLPHAADSSFPSDHLTVLSAVAFTLFFGGRKWSGFIVLVAGLAVAWARIFVGVHFPLDMAGAVLVSGLAYAVVTPPWRIGGAAITRQAVALYQAVFARPIGLGWLRR